MFTESDGWSTIQRDSNINHQFNLNTRSGYISFLQLIIFIHGECTLSHLLDILDLFKNVETFQIRDLCEFISLYCPSIELHTTNGTIYVCKNL